MKERVVRQKLWVAGEDEIEFDVEVGTDLTIATNYVWPVRYQEMKNDEDYNIKEIDANDDHVIIHFEESHI